MPPIFIPLYRTPSGKLDSANYLGAEFTGGTAALSYLLSGDKLTNGQSITIATNGVFSFGSKSQGSPVLYDLGDVAYENGVANTSMSALADGTPTDEGNNTIYEQIGNSPLIRKSNKRHDGVGFHYQKNTGVGSEWVGKPFAFGPNTASFGGYDREPRVDELYASWWFKTPYPVNQYYEVAITNQVGVFETRNGKFAEELIVTGGSEIFSMSLIGQHTHEGNPVLAMVALRNDGQGVGSANTTGASVTGAISGATADLDPATYSLSWGGSSKFIRVWDDITGVSGVRTSWTNSQLTNQGGTNSEINTDVDAGQWNHLEIHMDLADEKITRYVNGQLLGEFSLPNPARTAGQSPSISLLGFDGKQVFNEAEWGEIYFDTTPQRLVFGNAPTWDACTHTEIQYTTAWSDTEITANVNLGTLGGNVYVYVIGLDGMPVNVNGVLIPITERGTEALKWTAPNGLTEGQPLTITTDGANPFGAVGPQFVMLVDTYNTTGNKLTVNDVKVGQGSTLSLHEEFDIVETDKLGKAIAMGASSSFAANQNGTDNVGKLWINHPPHPKQFESRATWWPLENQVNAESQLNGTNTWQLKNVWRMADQNYLSEDTDFFMSGEGYAFYNPTSKFKRSGGTLSTNSVPTRYFNSLANSDNNIADPYNRIYPEVYFHESYADQKNYDGITANNEVDYRASKVGFGEVTRVQENDLILAVPTGATRVVNSFSYPGFVRGFSAAENANFYESELYYAIGDGAFCRVVLSDHEDFFQSSAHCVLVVEDSSDWENNQIVINEFRTGIFRGNVSGLYINILDANNTQIGSIPTWQM